MMNKNTFAKTPPMGWNSYDYYDTTVDEAAVRANADYMAQHLKVYGWEYIAVDIQWYALGAGSERNLFQYIPFSKLEMDEYSRLLPDPERFPSSVNGAGFGPLAEYVHSLGLKFGIHIMRGIPRQAAHAHCQVLGSDLRADRIADPSSICGWNSDMYGVRNIPQGQAYYDSLLELYASWGVDYIKCDDICNTNLYPQKPYSAAHEVEMLHRAIEKCGRPIVLSLSPGPALIDRAWHYETYANMWRITDDFWDDWKLLKAMFYRCELWQDHVAEGCYPDCDMLPLGTLGKGFGRERTSNFTREEQRTMLTLWCLFGSPLMIGAELTKLDEETLQLLTNREVLDMLPPTCRPRQVCRDEEKAVWAAYDREKKSAYVALFNLKDREAQVAVNCGSLLTALTAVGMPQDALLTGGKELWTGESMEPGMEGFPEKIQASVTTHGCRVWRFRTEQGEA